MPQQRNRAKLYVLLIFLCGSLSGALAANLWKDFGPRISKASADAPVRQQRLVDKLKRHLGLSPEQVTNLDRILEETRGSYRGHEAAMAELKQQNRARIRELLTYEQQMRFDEIVTKYDRRKAQRAQ